MSEAGKPEGRGRGKASKGEGRGRGGRGGRGKGRGKGRGSEGKGAKGGEAKAGDGGDDFEKPKRRRPKRDNDENADANGSGPGAFATVAVGNLSFETKRDGLAEHLGVAEHRVEVLMRPDGRSSGRARVCFPSRAEAEAVIEKVHQTDLDGRTISLSVKRASTAAGETIVTLRNLPPTTKTGDVTKHVKRVTERGSVGRIVFKKKDQSVDVAFRSRAGAEAAALQLDGTELAGRTLSARVSPRKPRSVSPRPATPPAPPSSNGSPRAGARSREAVVAALSAWVAARRPDRTHSRNLDAFYHQHPHLGRKPKGSAWLTPDLLAAQGLQQRPDGSGGGFFLEVLDAAAAAIAPIAKPASDGAAAILALVARADALRPRLERRDEDIRARVQSVLQKAVSFRRCAVGVFGSAASGRSWARRVTGRATMRPAWGYSSAG